MAFKRLDPEDFLVSSDSITAPLWSTGAPTLIQFFTSSVQEAGSSGNYYLSVYQTASNLSIATVQFDVAYGDSLGSGSTWYNPIVPENSYTKTIYGQYRSLILEDENSSFIFGAGNNTYTTDNFWILSIERANYKQSLLPGSLNIKVSGSAGIINLRATTVNTLFGTQTQLSATLTIVGLDSGARLTIPITINKTN